MKIELDKGDADTIGSLLVFLKKAKFEVTGEEVINLYSHMNKAFELRKRILDAGEGSVAEGKIESQEVDDGDNT